MQKLLKLGGHDILGISISKMNILNTDIYSLRITLFPFHLEFNFEKWGVSTALMIGDSECFFDIRLGWKGNS